MDLSASIECGELPFAGVLSRSIGTQELDILQDLRGADMAPGEQSGVATHSLSAGASFDVDSSTIPFNLDWMELSDGLLPSLVEAHNNVLQGARDGMRFIGACVQGEEELGNLAKEIRGIRSAAGRGPGNDTIWRKFPGAAALFLVEAAIYEYAGGDYWHAPEDLIGLSVNDRRTWGENFRLFLQTLGLCVLPAPGHRRVKGIYLRPILLHARIPNDCLPDFFDVLFEPAVRSASLMGLSPGELIREWLDRSTTSVRVAQPVTDFLEMGGEAAEEFVKGAKEAARRRLEEGEIPPSEETHLPSRVVKEYETWCEKGGEQRYPARIRKPVLRLDPTTGVYIELPEQRLGKDCEAQSALWCIQYPENRRVPVAVAPSPAGPKSEDTECLVSPEGPYRISFEVSGEVLGQWEITGMESQQWKAFADGDLSEIKYTDTLDRKPVWFVLPFGGSIEGVEELDCSELSEWWYGYKAVRIDPFATSQVTINADDETAYLDVATGTPTVELTDGDLLQPAEFAPDGVPIYGDTPPCLSVKCPAGADMLKEIRLRRGGQSVA
ncbi:MAG: hypothetical protein ACOC0A_03360, partial [Planctomycetota bacterium]